MLNKPDVDTNTEYANKHKSRAIPSAMVPKYCVSRHYNEQEYDIKNILSAGLQLDISDDDNTQESLIFEWVKAPQELSLSSPQHLLTENGCITLYNYKRFIQTLSGVSLENESTENGEIFSVALSRLPQKMKDLFGWLSPQDTNKSASSSDEILLSLRINAHDISHTVFIKSDYTVWKRILVQSQLTPVPKVRTLPLPKVRVPCVVGKVRLTPHLYKTLDVGDIVLLDNPLFNTRGTGNIRLADQLLTVAVTEEGDAKGTQFTVTHITTVPA